MARTPPQPDAASQIGKAAGIGGVALGALVALAVAALFLVQIGGNRSGWPGARESYRTRANPSQLQGAPAVPRASPPRPRRQSRSAARKRPKPHATRTPNKAIRHDHYHHR